MGRRGHYREPAEAALAAIEARRRELGVTLGRLAEAASMDLRTLYRLRSTRRAFPRQLKALERALAAIAREKRREADDAA